MSIISSADMYIAQLDSNYRGYVIEREHVDRVGYLFQRCCYKQYKTGPHYSLSVAEPSSLHVAKEQYGGRFWCKRSSQWKLFLILSFFTSFVLTDGKHIFIYLKHSLSVKVKYILKV